MNAFPEQIAFKYPWRKYQQRVLNELQEHLDDRHLHVIAPPGSGKTVLGLEVALRLNKPTLILAPTIAIRNQWVQRFCELFLQTDTTPEWISRNIRAPGFMTIVTYQGLHAACNNANDAIVDLSEDAVIEAEGEPAEDTENRAHTTGQRDQNSRSGQTNLDAIAAALSAQQVQTIVVDEAHHLKNEWWQTLTQLKEKLDPVIVGLTATPPYDVTATEWLRYVALNGPVDTEISVPELVIEGDLCPHQDYVFFSLPTDAEAQEIARFRKNIDELFAEFQRDEILTNALENHPIWANPDDQLEWIYSNLPYYSACLIFLHANRREIPLSHSAIIDDGDLQIPEFTPDWAEVLLDFYLYKEKEHFAAFDEHRKRLENRLKRCGVLERRKISLTQNKRVTTALTSSLSKLDSIHRIVQCEYEQLKQDLRLVILTDYIRKEFFVNEANNTLELNKIGIMPIFEKLRRDNRQEVKVGVLTGSIIIIPLTAYAAFQEQAARYGIASTNATAVPFDDQYLLVTPSEQLKHDIVHIITQIFQAGEIEVLIGTKSLLGEGWDAPAINALILASFVGSFVLSNQMRGRAIRSQTGNAEKTGNIWHLVCVDPSTKNGGSDLELLQRRFRGFVGVSFKENSGIENGIYRLDIPKNIHMQKAIEHKNAETTALAIDRESLNQRWQAALATGVNLVEELKLPFPMKANYAGAKKLALNQTIKNIAVTLALGVGLYFGEAIQALGRSQRSIKTLGDLYIFLAIFGVIGIAIFGRQSYRLMRLYINYRDIAKDTQRIGEALVRSMIGAGLIHTDIDKLCVKSSVDDWGSVYCHLEGGTTFEHSGFINALQEVVQRVDNPRYVITRKSRLYRWLKQKDFHAVPDILGRNKKTAEYFHGQWKTWVGDSELIFTRTIEGRRLLLKARVKSLAAEIDDQVVHVNKWK